MWADHRLKPGAEPVYEMRHPLVGAVTITQQSLRTEHGQHIVLATADIGSPSHAAWSLLAHSAAAARRVRPEAPATP